MRLRRVAAVVALAAALTTPGARPAAAHVVVAGFRETLAVSGLDAPVAIDFLPDGRLLVAEFGGALRLVEDGQPHTVYQVPDLATCPTASSETGLLGLAVDPDFAVTRHVFLFRTRRGPEGGCSSTGRVNEIVRVRLGEDDLVETESLTVLLTGIATDTGFHNAGCLRFGPDGRLYASTGDTGAGDFNGQGPGAQTNPYARDLARLEGKILRLSKDGSVPADNPFVDTPGARAEVFASGLRNPFRFGFDPATGRLWAGDVGEDDVEEIDIVRAGDDLGWPACEGDLPAACPAPGTVAPVYAYRHPQRGGASVTGGDFAPEGFGDFGGHYLFADYIAGDVRRLVPNGSRDGVDGDAVLFRDGLSGPVDLRFGPDGALYVATLGNGRVYRVAPDAGGEQPLAPRRLSVRAPRPRLTLRARDDVVFGGVDDDPTEVGGSLEVTVDGESVAYPLPAAGWTSKRKRQRLTTFVYRDRRGERGPVRRMTLRAGKGLDVTAAGDGLAQGVGDVPPAAVEVHLVLGGRTWCTAFGAPTRFRPGRSYRVGRGEAPVHCRDDG